MKIVVVDNQMEAALKQLKTQMLKKENVDGWRSLPYKDGEQAPRQP